MARRCSATTRTPTPVTVLGPLFDAASPLSWATGEGWYFSATKPTRSTSTTGPKLYRYDVLGRTLETVFDVASQFGPNRYIWQTHSSDDDRVHSATLRSSVHVRRCSAAWSIASPRRTFSFFPAIGDFDECQVDKSGRWLLIKENVDGVYGEDNRIIDLQPGPRHCSSTRRAPPATPTMATATWWPRTTGTRCPAPCACGRSASRDARRCRPRAGSCTGRRTGRSTSDTSLTPTRGPACPLEEQYACGAPGDARRGPARQRDRVLPPRRLAAGAGGRAHDDRPQRRRRGNQRLRQAPEGQPRHHRPATSSGRAMAAASGSTPSSSRCRPSSSAAAGPPMRRRPS